MRRRAAEESGSDKQASAAESKAPEKAPEPSQYVRCPCGLEVGKEPARKFGCPKCKRVLCDVDFGDAWAVGTLCSVCGQVQYNASMGVNCHGGHGAVKGLSADEWKAIQMRSKEAREAIGKEEKKPEEKNPEPPKHPPREKKFCPVQGCGAELTETSLDGDAKWFCPDSSTKHPKLAVEQRKGSTSVVPDVHKESLPRRADPSADDVGEVVTVTWGKETVNLAKFCNFEIGPFVAQTSIRPGESRGDAMLRAYRDLASTAVDLRKAKGESFHKELVELGVIDARPEEGE